MKDILARSEKAKDDLKDFLSAASHELRTPLNGIIGLSESVLESGDCSPFVSKSLSVIKDCGRRLAGLVSAPTKRLLCVRPDQCRAAWAQRIQRRRDVTRLRAIWAGGHDHRRGVGEAGADHAPVSPARSRFEVEG
eukprot:3675818-Rhodomonas_salina.1